MLDNAVRICGAKFGNLLCCGREMCFDIGCDARRAARYVDYSAEKQVVSSLIQGLGSGRF